MKKIYLLLTKVSLLSLVTQPGLTQLTVEAQDLPPPTPQVWQEKRPGPPGSWSPGVIEAQTEPPATESITSVSQLSDVQPTDWAFQALQSFINRYGCLAGYSDSAFQGNRALTRYEFAAGMSACFNKIREQIDNLPPEDLTTLQQLQDQFGTVTNLQGRVAELEAQTATLKAEQFSTTTELAGQAIFAVTGGGFSGERIVGPTGVEVTGADPNATFLYRARLDLNTSFNGSDLLKLRLHTGSDRGGDNLAGFLEPTFGSVLDFSVKPATDALVVGRLYYTFTPFQDFTVSLGPAIIIADYVDRNSYANLSFRDFTTQALVNNYILFPIYGPSSGAAIGWNPDGGALTLRAVYAAGDAGSANSQGVVRSVAPFTRLLYPDGNGKHGLLGDPYQSTIELEYSPSPAFALRLQYSGGQVLGGQFDVLGANFELALSQQLAVFGRYGSGSYQDTAFGDIKPNYWMVGVAFQDLFVPGTLAGIAAGQPFIEGAVGNAAQTNIEAFYNYPLSTNISITPLVQVILDPANQSRNGTIVTGTLRTVFSF